MQRAASLAASRWCSPAGLCSASCSSSSGSSISLATTFRPCSHFSARLAHRSGHFFLAHLINRDLNNNKDEENDPKWYLKRALQIGLVDIFKVVLPSSFVENKIIIINALSLSIDCL